MSAAPIPADEEARLRSLRSLRLLDTEPEAEFDDVATIAAALMDCPIAYVSMVDASRQWLKAKVGLDACETAREASFCAHAILAAEPLLVPDAALDPRFVGNPLVTGERGIRFYCGVPILVDGHAVGTLCAADGAPRTPTGAQVRALSALARQTSALLEARRVADHARASEELLRTATEVAFDGFSVLSPVRDDDGEAVDLRFDLANERAARFFDLPQASLIGMPLLESFPTEGARRLVGRLLQVLVSGEPFEEEYVSRVPSMEGRWVRLQAARAGERVAVTGRDVHERRKAENALRDSKARLATTFDALPVGAMLVARDGSVLRSNPAAARILETAMASIYGAGRSAGYELLRPTGDPMPLAETPIAQALRGETVRDVDLRLRWPDGRERWVRTNAEPLWTEGEATPYAAVCGFLDLTVEVEQRRELDELVRETAETNILIEAQRHQLEQANESLSRLATTDGLTGLRNHRAFQERLEEEVLTAFRTGEPLSIALLDVDRFKAFNDDHGHQAGDGVLRGVAERLATSAREGDLVARYGGEEFVILMPNADAREALLVAERLRVAIEASRWTHRSVTASLGVATLAPGMGREALIETADRAMYRSKHAGRNRVTVGSPI